MTATVLDRVGDEMPEESPLKRAHSIVVSAGADTARDLAFELRNLADRIERKDITKGCIGGSISGAIYSYEHDPSMTHDRYFQEIDRRLRSEKNG